VWIQLSTPLWAITNIAIINKAGSNTNTLNAANGIPIININKVDGAGHSINEYDIFDVGSSGIIFNNSSGLSNTELAGWIVGNSNLKDNQNATLILNTVKSKRSELGGYMEVAGKSADIIILNSNGILCDGCGFLNVNRGVLSTGEAQFSNGKFVGISTAKGEVEIGRGGLNAVGANRIDIISQQLRLNGVIQGHEVNVALGGADYDYNSGVMRANNLNSNTQYVISSSEFGGMYGDSIRLVSYNKSVGVNIDFNMATSSSHLVVDAAGNLKIAGKLSSAADMNIKGANVEIGSAAELNSKQFLSLSGNDLNFYGKINTNNLNVDFNSIYMQKSSQMQAQGDAEIKSSILGSFAGSILGVNIKIIGGDINILGDIAAVKQLHIDSQQTKIEKSGSVNSQGNITFSGNSLDIWGRVIAANELNLNSSDIYLEEGSLTQGKTVSINANNLDLKSNSSITSMGDFFIKLAGDFNLRAGVNFAANNNLNLSAYNINLYAGVNLSSNGSMSLSGNNLNVGIGNDVSNSNNQDTIISSKGDVSIDIAGESNIAAAGKVLAGGLLTFRSENINNRGLIAGNDILFRVDYLNNWGKERIGNSYNSYENMGVIYGIGSINIEGYNGGNAKKILNSSSKIQTLNGDININADIFENTLTWWDIYERIGEWRTVYEDKLIEKYNYYPCGILFYCKWKFGKYETLSEREIIYDLYGANAATLSSGGNINIKGGDLINRNSIVSAVGNISLDVNNFRNETVVSPKSNYKELNSYTYEITPVWKHDTCESGSGGNDVTGGGGTYPCDIIVDSEITNQQTNNYTENTGRTAFSQGALIAAGGDISISVSGDFDNIYSNQTQNQDNNIDYNTGSNISQEDTINIDFVDGNMFYVSDGTNGYLIETDPYFTDLQKFKGSAYFLHLLGLDKDKDLILGDGFVDLEVVGDQILNNTGKEILDGYTSKEDQLEGLMQAGVDAKDELGLILGESLTPEQLAQLKQPIIWWVRKVINGQSVLVPQVFFPANYNTNNNQNGSTINGGGNVNINVGGNANNSGNINGGGLVDINVGNNLDNSGNIHGDGGVNIDVGGDFNNTGNISDANKGSEYHQKEMEDMANNIENNINALEDMQKEYESRAEQYKLREAEYNDLFNRYQAMLSGLKRDKYAGKVWSGDIKQQEYNSEYGKNMAEMEAQLAAMGEILKSEGEYLNGKAEDMNSLSDSIKLQVEDLNNYVDNLPGVNINVGGDFQQDGKIEADKILVDVQGKLSSIEGLMSSTFSTTINADSIALIGASISGSEVNLKANNIELWAAERYNNKGYVSELISSNVSGGSVNLNSAGDIYISSSNIYGNTISLEAGEDIVITGQAIEKELTWDEMKNETVSYTNIDNPNEVISGNAEDLKNQHGDKFNISGVKEEHVGSNVVANESLVMSGENIGIYGSTIYSEGLLALQANNVLEIGVLEDNTEIDYSLEQKKTEKHGAWHSKKKTITKIRDDGSINYTHNVGSTIAGDSVYLGAVNDVNIIGSVIANTDSSSNESESESTNSEGDGNIAEDSTSGSLSSSSSTSSDGSTLEQPKAKPAEAWEGIQSGDIIINAGNNLNILGAEDKRNTSLSTDISITEMSYGFGSIVDSAKALGDAATVYYKGFADGFKSKEGFLQGVNNTSNVLGALAGTTNLFSINGHASETKTHVEYKEESTEYVGSVIGGGNIMLNSKNDINIKGSTISANNDVSMEAVNNINITAGENTYSSSKYTASDTNSINVSAGVSITGFSGSVGYSYNHMEGKDYTENHTYSGSIISAGNNASFKAGEDINLIGSNIAGKNVTTDSQNLNIESLQNEYKAWGSSETYGFSVGAGYGEVSATPNSVNGGINYGESSYDNYNKITENTAGISASNDLNINANNNVKLTGAVLEGKNSTNIKSDSLTIENLKDISTSKSSGFNFNYSMSIGLGNNADNQLKSDVRIMGALNAGINSLEGINKYTQWFNASVDANKQNTKDIYLVKGGISDTENIYTNNIIINNNQNQSTNSIWSDTQNNRETTYENKSESSWSVAPSEWLSNSSNAIRTVADYTVAGSNVIKATIKTYNALKDNGNKGFWEVYGFQGKIDKIQIDSRNENINLLEDSDKYNSLLVKNDILDNNLNTVFYLDGAIKEDGSYTAGYSQKHESEIGINLASNGGNQDTAGELENSYWHEVSHQYDTTNTTEQDRENFATNIGNSAQSLGNINNFLYGDGGLDQYSITHYIVGNLSQLQQNTQYVNSLNPLSIDNAVYMVSRGLGSDSSIRFVMPAAHQFLVITGDEKYLNNYIKDYTLKYNYPLIDEKGSSVDIPEARVITNEMNSNGIGNEQDNYYITLGGYRGDNHIDKNPDGSEKGYLIKNINAPDDIRFLESGHFDNIEVKFNNQLTQEINEENIVKAYNNYDNNANYFFVPNNEYKETDYQFHYKQRIEENKHTYNSNSFAYSMCSYAGGSNCNYSGFIRFSPGLGKLIPELYFNINK